MHHVFRECLSAHRCAEEKSLRLQQEIVTQQRHWRLFSVARRILGAKDDAEVEHCFKESREEVLKDLKEEEHEALEKDVDMTQ